MRYSVVLNIGNFNGTGKISDFFFNCGGNYQYVEATRLIISEMNISIAIFSS